MIMEVCSFWNFTKRPFERHANKNSFPQNGEKNIYWFKKVIFCRFEINTFQKKFLESIILGIKCRNKKTCFVGDFMSERTYCFRWTILQSLTLKDILLHQMKLNKENQTHYNPHEFFSIFHYPHTSIWFSLLHVMWCVVA